MDFPVKSVESDGEPSGEHRPPGSSKGRRWARLLAVLGTMTVFLTGWRIAPTVKDRVRLHLAERAIADGRLDEAEERLDLLIAEHPARPWPRFRRARVAREQGHLTEAEEKLQRAIELGLPVEQARAEHSKLRAAVSGQRSAGADEGSPVARVGNLPGNGGKADR